MSNKLFLVIFLILPISMYAQRYVLIDKELSKPILHADTGSTKQKISGYIGLYTSDIDSVVFSLKNLRDFFPPRSKKANTIHINLAHSMILGERIHQSYGDRYDINLYTFSGELSGKVIVSNSRLSNKINVAKLNQLISYLSAVTIVKNTNL